jgi:hypothetical protein
MTLVASSRNIDTPALALQDAVHVTLTEMRHDSVEYEQSVFYVEAIVGADNKLSQRVAKQGNLDAPVAVTDQVSGLPAFRYVRKIEHPTAS